LETEKLKITKGFVENMLSKFKNLGVKMSIKIHDFSQLDRFPAKLGDQNEEHGGKSTRTFRSWKRGIRAQGRERGETGRRPSILRSEITKLIFY